MSALKTYLARNRWAKLTANHAYVYVIHMIHMLLNLMPWFIRNFCFRLMLGRSGALVFFDHEVYIKFPWLVEVGDNASINRGVSFYPGFFGGYRIILGNNVRLAPGVRLHAAGHDVADLSYADTGGTIVIEDDVWVGAGAIVLPGVTIGARSVIGAGAVVNRDVPPDSIAVGVPAKVVKKRLDAR